MFDPKALQEAMKAAGQFQNNHNELKQLLTECRDAIRELVALMKGEEKPQ